MKPLLADALLAVHALFIAFVVLGQVLILAGVARRWAWIRNPRFRLAHLLAIGFVAAEAWWGMDCPLTVWENRLRRAAGGAAYDESFLAHWLHRICFFDLPPLFFTVAYTVFAAVVALTWFLAPPRRR